MCVHVITCYIHTFITLYTFKCLIFLLMTKKRKFITTLIYILFFLKILFILFLERGREGEKEGEKHQCVVASCMLPTGDLACNPGMCPRLGIELVTL